MIDRHFNRLMFSINIDALIQFVMDGTLDEMINFLKNEKAWMPYTTQSDKETFFEFFDKLGELKPIIHKMAKRGGELSEQVRNAGRN